MIDANFQVCSKVTFLKNYEPGTKPYGSIRVGLEVEPAIFKGHQINKHPLFLDIQYKAEDLHKGGFETFRNRLAVGLYVFVSGNLKVKPANDKWPSSIAIATNWRNVIVRAEAPRYKNEFVISGKVLATSPSLTVSIRRRNPKTNEWVQQDFPVVLDRQWSTRVGEQVVVEGTIYGINPKDNKSMVWLAGSMVY